MIKSENTFPYIGETTTDSYNIALIKAAAREIGATRIQFLGVGQRFGGDATFVHKGQIGFKIFITREEQRATFRTTFKQLLAQSKPSETL